MKNADNQAYILERGRMGAAIRRTGAAENCRDAATSRIGADINVAIINVGNIVINSPGLKNGYYNGRFIPVFQDALLAIVCNENVKPGTIRVMNYLMSVVDEKNCITESVQTIANHLHISDDTVRRALSQLIQMQVLCRKSDTGDRCDVYALSDKLMNPRLAYKGNTRLLNKDFLPPLLSPMSTATNNVPLIVGDKILPSPDF